MFHHSEQQLPTALNSYLDFPESPEFPDTLESPENQKKRRLPTPHRRHRRYGSPHRAVATFTGYSKDLLRPRIRERAGRL